MAGAMPGFCSPASAFLTTGSTADDPERHRGTVHFTDSLESLPTTSAEAPTHSQCLNRGKMRSAPFISSLSMTLRAT